LANTAIQIELLFETVHRHFLEPKENWFPVKYYKTKAKNKDKSWINLNIKTCIREKNKCYKKWKSESLEPQRSENFELFKKSKNHCTSIIRNAKNEYYKNLLIKNNKNTHEKWKIINDLLYKSKKHVDIYLISK
jgi:hypothetical protein